MWKLGGEDGGRQWGSDILQSKQSMIIWFGGIDKKLDETSCGKEWGVQIYSGVRTGSKLDNQAKERRGNGVANGF